MGERGLGVRWLLHAGFPRPAVQPDLCSPVPLILLRGGSERGSPLLTEGLLKPVVISCGPVGDGMFADLRNERVTVRGTSEN